MRKVAFFIFILIAKVSFASSTPAWVQNVHEVKLKNGMVFLLYPRGEAPIFSGYIRFRVGGIDEEAGKSGLAHFLEHMAFKGTKTLGTTNYEKEVPLMEEIEKIGQALSQEYLKKEKADSKKIEEFQKKLGELHQEQEKYLVKEALAKTMLEHGGADYNATTSKDMTSYFVSLPSDQLQFWATLESERIFKPVFREFYEERNVVLEERRMRVDNDPDGQLYEAFLGKAFSRSPYKIPTIGTADEIRQLTRTDLEKFWARYYDPSNAVGAIVGRIDVNEAKKILEETFGKIPSKGPVSFPQYVAEPEQKEEKRVSLNLSARPRILIGYHKPTIPSKDDYTFDLLRIILADGRSSRLYRSLVLETGMASGVWADSSVPGSRLDNLFLISADLLGGHKPSEVLAQIDQILEKISQEGPSQIEMEKAKNQLKSSFLWTLKSNESVASSLTHYYIAAGNWQYMANYLDEIDRLTIDDVKKVAQTYLIYKNRTIAAIE